MWLGQGEPPVEYLVWWFAEHYHWLPSQTLAEPLINLLSLLNTHGIVSELQKKKEKLKSKK